MAKYRNEWKYVCSETALRALEERLAAMLALDAHTGPKGCYEVHSLYFDDLRDACASEKEAGTGRRYKYRIRYYDRDADKLFLERKEKRQDRCQKRICSLTRREYEALLSGRAEEILWETQEPLLKRFCVDSLTRGFRPCAVIDYERTAYVEEIGNVRITLDRNISVSAEIGDFLSESGGIPVQEKGWHILEVKFDEILPGHIRRMVADPHLRQVSWSKYYNGRRCLRKVRSF